MRRFIRTTLLLSVSSFFTAQVYAGLPNSFYLLANAGVFQGNFDTQYNDLTDAIPANIRQPVLQNGYSGGLGVGYNYTYAGQYLLGVELTGNYYSHHANFASGAASTSFTDQLNINRNVDLVFLPGMLINEITAFYGKAGLSYGHVNSSVSSPTGFAPAYVQTSSSTNVLGGVLGLGAKRLITTHICVFAEYLYHDYRNINFQNFQNFSATYNHSVRLTTQNVVAGINYYF